MGGGGQTSTNKFEPPGYTQQPWQDFLTNAQGLANKGITPYEGQRVAELNPMQGAGYQMLNDYMLQGTPERAAGGAAVLNATQGNMNPYATQANPYGGDNPYLRSMINNSNDAISQNFAKGTAAQTDASAAMQKGFGGSAYNEHVQDNNKTLGGLLSSNTNNLLQQQYNNSQGIAENALNRATGAYDNTQNRALQGAQIGQGQQQIDLQSILAGLQGGNGLAGYEQNILNANKGLYDERQQAPFTMSDFLRNALQGASGTGGMNTSTTPGASPWTTGAGLLSAGMGAYMGM